MTARLFSRQLERLRFICLDMQWLAGEDTYRIACSQGHVVNILAENLPRFAGCPRCTQEKRRLDPAVLRQIVAQRGGRCLSTTYYGTRSNTFWECAKGHRWLAVLFAVKQGGWCPQCLLVTLDDLQQVAALRGGQCLTCECHGANRKRGLTDRWMCEVTAFTVEWCVKG